MEIRPLSHFSSQELRSLMAEEREKWSRRLYWDYGEPQRVISAMVDARSLAGFVALERADPVAYVFYVELGWKGLLGGCFASSTGSDGAEPRLLERAVSVLQGNSAITRIESQFVNFRDWGISQFFVEKGFRQFDRCFMVRDCQLEPPAKRPVAAELTQFQIGDIEAIARLTLATYASSVDRQVTYHYQSLEDCREFINNLVFRPGCGSFLPEASYAAKNLQTGELMGYLLTSRISAEDGHVPQIAVAANHQGKGLGAELLRRGIRYLALNGYRRVSLTVTEANFAAMGLYRSFGFLGHFRFPVFAWVRDRQIGQ